MEDSEILQLAKKIGYSIEEAQFGHKKLVDPNGVVILEPTNEELAIDRLREELSAQIKG